MADRSGERTLLNPARKLSEPIYETLVRKNYLSRARRQTRLLSRSAIAELFSAQRAVIGLRETFVGELFIRRHVIRQRQPGRN